MSFMELPIIKVAYNRSVHLPFSQHFLNKALELSFSNRIYRHMCPNESELTEYILHYTHVTLSAEVFQNTYILASLCFTVKTMGEKKLKKN